MKFHENLYYGSLAAHAEGQMGREAWRS